MYFQNIITDSQSDFDNYRAEMERERRETATKNNPVSEEMPDFFQDILCPSWLEACEIAEGIPAVICERWNSHPMTIPVVWDSVGTDTGIRVSFLVSDGYATREVAALTLDSMTAHDIRYAVCPADIDGLRYVVTFEAYDAETCETLGEVWQDILEITEVGPNRRLPWDNADFLESARALLGEAIGAYVI